MLRTTKRLGPFAAVAVALLLGAAVAVAESGSSNDQADEAYEATYDDEYHDHDDAELKASNKGPGSFTSGPGDPADRLARHRAGLASSDAIAVLRPTVDGRELPDRVRPDREHTLVVLVTESSPHGPKPADGAKVAVFELEHHGRTFFARPVAHGETNDDGLVRFELTTGRYIVGAGNGETRGFQKVGLHDDKRIHLHLGDRDRGPAPGPVSLGIWALERGSDGHAEPVPGAQVTVQGYNATGDAPRNGTWHTVARGVTDENGQYTTVLRKGLYRVLVFDGEHDGVERVPLRQDTWVRIALDGPTIVEGDAPSQPTLDATPIDDEPASPPAADDDADEAAADDGLATTANATDANASTTG